MLETLAENPLLTIFVVVALGALIGQIPFGPMRFGAAGALFVGLILSAANPAIGHGMGLLQGLGLIMFVYTVGVGAGQTFVTGFRSHLPLFGIGALATVGAAVVTVVGGHLFGLNKALVTGLFTGALTAAPALDTATKLTGSPLAAVGYALAYPLAVVVAIIFASVVAPLSWPGKCDEPSLAGSGIAAQTVLVEKCVPVRAVPGYRNGKVRLSYLRRGQRTRVVSPGEDLLAGDLVVVVGVGDSAGPAIDFLGKVVDEHLADDRSEVEFERYVVSNPDIAGRSVAELNLCARFGAVVTRVRRGDLDLLASDTLVLEPGDHVAVVTPRDEMAQISDFFGDSERKVSEVDALAVGIGLVLGLLAGLIQVPLPGGAVFSLGPAAGPLIVGMALGALRRTGPLIWVLPQSATLTIRQLGLLFFLAGLGLVSGPEFARIAASAEGVRGGLVSVVAVGLACLVVVVGGRLVGLSAPRTAGTVAGMLGQPAVLSAASDRVADERIETAYAALFAFAMIVKILLVPVIFSL
ncbi:MAG: TrkA C-terminal domain-containing protein [Actinomycetaceae bacterium]|nr:TrkA C-terminal domain-containing protein [Actinomycetaceae bacterium]